MHKAQETQQMSVMKKIDNCSDTINQNENS